MVNQKKTVVSSTLEVVPEIPTPVMNHIIYVANSMKGKSNLVDADIDDIIQTLSFEVLKAMPSIKKDPKYINGNAYLNKTVDNQANVIYRYRKARALDKPMMSFDECGINDDERSSKLELPIVDDTAKQDFDIDIQTVLSTLSPDLRQIFQLRMDGCSFKEISTITGIPESTVRIWRMNKVRAAFAHLKNH